MLEQAVEILRKRHDVHDWVARHIHASSTQYYVIGRYPESRRTVTSERVVVTVMNDHPPANGDQALVRGAAEVTLLSPDAKHVEEQVDRAVSMAALTDNPPYGLPPPSEYPTVDLVDSEMQDRPWEVAEHMVRELGDALAAEEDTRLSSAEVFVNESSVVLLNSTGASGTQTKTQLLLDFVLLASRSDKEMESHSAFTRRRAADLKVRTLAHRHAQYARDAIVAGIPRTGTFPVIVSDEALAELLMGLGFSPLVFCSSAQSKYQRMTTCDVGKRILKEQANGDPFTLHSNSLLPYGTRSGRFDGEGVPAQRVAIIENGILSRFWATQRYAEYLGTSATGDFGNMEIAAGSTPFESLFRGQGPLYHIVAFSAMDPDPLTGNFVGEIRLGYEIEEGQRSPIRGGSISGNLFDVLAAARLSQETIFLGDYLGPRAMRFPQVTVAGE
jgi:PmbA protein